MNTFFKIRRRADVLIMPIIQIMIIALALTPFAYGQTGKKPAAAAGVKLLERIKYESVNYERFDQTFVYDNKNRIVKMTRPNGKTVALAYMGDELASIQGMDYKKVGNTITLDKDIITVNYDGYIVKRENTNHPGYVARYHYRGGNLVKMVETQEGESGQTVCEYKYDDKKSPLLNCRTPKWFISHQLQVGAFGLKNNITEFLYTTEFVHNGQKIKETLEHFTYSFEYDKDGYPVREVHLEMGEEEVANYMYRGEGLKP